jgi:hypothetical protein
MSNISKSTLKELIDTFDKIHDILVRENENNWIKGINSIRERLVSAEGSNGNIDEVYKEIGVSYRSMNSGAGSFADFLVWRDDFDERQRLNQEFEALADKAWRLLDL